MSRHIFAWLAWSLWAVCVALIALSLLLDFLTPRVGLPTGLRPDPSLAVLTGILSGFAHCRGACRRTPPR
jgi:hypothetical protein